MPEHEVFVSTGGFRDIPSNAVSRLSSEGITNIELSGGEQEPDLNLDSLRPGIKFQLHNYFPPADPPFVYNLASLDQKIVKRTFDCLSRSIALSAELGASRFSFHAGFLVDPPLSYLGNTWSSLELADVGTATRIFVDAVRDLAQVAKEHKMELLVENNVLTEETQTECGPDVLLMASHAQIVEVMEKLPSGVGLLMDVGHLNVSAHTMNFSRIDALLDLTEITRGYHLSENNGRSDANDALTPTSWFWTYLGNDIPFATLEVSPCNDIAFVEQVTMTTALWEGAHSL